MALGDSLLNQIRKKAEESGAVVPETNKLKSKAALIISIFAAIYSFDAFIGNTLNSRILNETIHLNDTYSFYQAKSIKQSLYQMAADDVEMVLEDKTINVTAREQLNQRLAKYNAAIARYESDPASGEGKRELLASAKKIEADRDRAKKQAPWIGIAGSVMQISIVLLTASILSTGMLMFWAGLAAQAVALALMAQGLFLFF
jgi:Domain of unknown function (DUF4337)